MYLRNVISRSFAGVREIDVQCVDDTGNITQNREQDVDEQVRAAAAFEEDTERWQDDGEDDFEDVAVFI